MSQVVEVRLGDLGQIEASEEARSDVEYTRSECEVRALRRQVAQIDECQEEASSRGPGQLGGGGHLGDGAIGGLGGEGEENGQGLLRRLHIVGALRRLFGGTHL